LDLRDCVEQIDLVVLIDRVQALRLVQRRGCNVARAVEVEQQVSVSHRIAPQIDEFRIMDCLCSTTHERNRGARSIDVSLSVSHSGAGAIMSEAALKRDHWCLLIESAAAPANRASVVAPYDGAEIAAVDIAG